MYQNVSQSIANMDIMTFMTTGERFKTAREDISGKTQGEAALYAKVGQGYLSDIENNKRWPSAWKPLERLARYYGVSIDYLFGISDNPRPAKQKPLPPGGSEMLETLEELSDRGRAELLSIAKVIREADSSWREYQGVREVIESVLDNTTLARLDAELPTMLANPGRSDIRRLLDALANYMRRETPQ
jgi:transcriptional regulator with XRE-family HTH domain